MKKGFFVALALVVGLVLAVSCTSAPKAGGTVSPLVEVDDSDDVRIDWRGRSAGVKEPPAWVILAAINDPDNELSRLSRLEGKKPVILFSKGANLEIVEAWLNTQAYGQAAQKIRSAVAASGNSGLEGDLAGPEAANMVNQFINMYAGATLTGYGKEMDYWVKTRSKSKGTEEYTMYALYAISKEDLKASIDETFKKIESKTAREEDLKTKLNAQMDRLMDSITF